MNIFSSKVSAHINCLLSTVYLLHNPKLFVNGSLAKNKTSEKLALLLAYSYFCSIVHFYAILPNLDNQQHHLTH